MNFQDFLERLSNIRVDRAQGPPKPYKPLLMLAVIVLIAKRKIATPHIFLDGGLVSVFRQLLEAIYPSWAYRADARYPFRHLENDRVWCLVPFDSAADELHARREAGARAREILRHVACARLDTTVFQTLRRSPEARLAAISTLVDRYLPPSAAAVVLRFLSSGAAATNEGAAARQNASLTERALEEHLVDNWRRTPFARMGVALSSRETLGLPGRQVLTPVNAIDLLGYQRTERRWWVIELKRGRSSDAVVGQVSRYLHWISQERREHGETAVGAIVVERPETKLLYAAQANDRLSVWRYDSDLEVTEATSRYS